MKFYVGLTSMTTDLVSCLSAFNRKERYWLIRNALGGANGDISLSDHFRHRLFERTKIAIPSNAWWAIDYHLDWLVGALAHFAHNEDLSSCTYENTIPALVTGSQEDFDLVVAFDRTVILFEAKFATGWSKEQLRSKVNRIHGLERMLRGRDVFYGDENPEGISLHAVLIAPKSMNESNLPTLQKPFRDVGQKPQFVPLETLAGPENFLAVQRCNIEKAPDRDGTNWRLIHWSNPAYKS